MAHKVNADTKVQAKAKRAIEGWKYEQLADYLKSKHIAHRFEFVLKTHTGKLRFYDLALRDQKLLIEFDGDYHHRNGEACTKRDRAKERLAEKHGWAVMRIRTKSNAVIPKSKIGRLIA